ncbi:glycosyltransferase family 4 protein [Candidatus Bipolaricaulota bacterium]
MKRDDMTQWPVVALIGSYQPPFGGISVHLKRFSEYLEREGVEHVLYNTVSAAERLPRVVSVATHRVLWYTRFLLTHRCTVVHLLSVNWLARVMFGVAAALRTGKYALSIHGRSVSQALKSRNLAIALLTRWLLRRMDAIIASNPDIARDCIELAGVSPERIHIIPAFIPPPNDGRAEVPEYVRDYMASHYPLLSAVGWIGQIHEGHDVYGIDMMVALVQRLKGDHPRIGLVISVNGGPKDAVRETIQYIRQVVGDNIRFVEDPLDEFTPIAQQSDLFLRPTNTDGDAVCIREALYVGTPVVASDAVPRPSSCVLFKNRDIDDFEYHVRQALSERDVLTRRITEESVVDNAESILLVYRRLMEKGVQRGASE